MKAISPKHIIIIGPAHPLRGGLASYDERLARAFQQQGHRVSIYTFSLQYPGFLFPGTTQYSSEPAPSDIDIKVVINSVNPFNWLTIGNQLSKLRPDLIVVRYWLPFMGPCLGTILRLVKRNKHTKVVCIADNIIPHEKRPGDAGFTKYFVRPVDAFITMSEQVLGDLPQFAPLQPAQFVAHPLYDNFGEPVPQFEARLHLQIAFEGPVLLFFGFIRKYKGLDWLLEAVALLKKDGDTTPDFRVLIAGEFYEEAQPYLDLIQQLDVADKLILKTDFIPDSEVKYYLCASDMVIQPYKSATQSGVTPLAYHFEKPMVVTRVGGLPSLVPHGLVGLVAEPSPAGIAEAIRSYLHTGSAHFLPHLREEKKRYSWEKLTAAIFEVASLH